MAGLKRFTPMKRRYRLSQFFQRMSITTRFGLGIGLLLFLSLTGVATGLISVMVVRHTQQSIQTSLEIQRLVLEMDRGMEKARHLHASFFLQYPNIGLARAHEQYAQPSARQISRAITISHKLKNLIDHSNVSDALRKSNTDLNLYLSSVKRFADTSIQSVELVTELAAPKRGLEARMEASLSGLAAEVINFADLRRLYWEMKLFAQDYRITRKRFLMQSAFNSAFVMRQEMAHDPSINPDQQIRINDLIDHFFVTAEKIMDIDVAIRSRFHDFALQSEAANAVSDTLVKLAQAEVTQAQKRIDYSRQTAITIVLAITLAGMIAAICIARMLNDRITKRVVRLNRSAGEFQNDRLDVAVLEDGQDELGQLAHTFNVMAGRIRDLIQNLEKTVECRTAELLESERRFRGLFEHSISGVAVYEPVDNGENFVFRDINTAAEILEGILRQDIIGKKVTEIFPEITDSGLLRIFRMVYHSGESVRHPVSYFLDGKLKYWREIAVYRLPSGEIVAVYDDLTTRKQAEIDKKNMEVRLHRAQKMETIGLLAGGVAHDLNNILSGIVSYPELILMQLPEDSKLRKPIIAIQESGYRAAAVVADLLTVARGIASVRKTDSLNRLVTNYLDSPEGRKLMSLHPDVRCSTQLSSSLYNISCSPIHITKCIMNLVTNAVEAIHGTGQIVISTHNETVDDDMARENSIQAGYFAVLCVSDDGNGISATDLGHIFEPFYTKKVMGKSGSGLGLAVVWNSVMDHGGTILVESSETGTTFKIYFPASEQEIPSGKIRNSFLNLKGNGETVLVVDDEAMQRDIATRMLQALNYDVVSSDSGENAIKYLQTHRVDLVLLDMVMDPGMNGYQTYRQILGIHPGQKAVIASGFSENEDVTNVRKLGAGGFVVKPYSLETLGTAIREQISVRTDPDTVTVPVDFISNAS